MTEPIKMCECGQSPAKPQYMYGERLDGDCCDACMRRAFDIATEMFVAEHARPRAKA